MPTERVHDVSILGHDVTEFTTQGFDTSSPAVKQWTVWLQKFAKSTATIEKIQAAVAEQEDQDHIPFEVNAKKGYGRIDIIDQEGRYVMMITIR